MGKRILVTLLCLLALVPCLASCGRGQTAMSYGESSVSVNMYRYWLSTYKASFLRTYSDMRDTDAFWDAPLTDGVTAEAYLNGMVQENVKRTLLCMELFRQLGLKVTPAMEAQVDGYIEDLINEQANGSRSAFNQILSRYGVNADILREIYLNEDKASLVFSHLYGEGGPREIGPEALDRYVAEHFVRVRHIYVNDAYAVETDENGYYKTNADGTAATRALTAEEAAAKAEKIRQIEAALADGEDFDAVYEQYSEDKFYENGYYLSRSIDFIDEVVDAAFTLAVGERTEVKSDYGTHFLLRLEPEARPYENEANADFFGTLLDDAKNDDFMAYLDTLLPDVVVYEDVIAPYSIRDAAANYEI